MDLGNRLVLHVSYHPFPSLQPLPFLPLCCPFTDFLSPSYHLYQLSDLRERVESEGEHCLCGFTQWFFKSWDRESLFHSRGFGSDLDYDCRPVGILFLPSPRGIISGIVCVHLWPFSAMPAPEGLESSSRNGSSWKGVTTGKGVSVSTCSENCAANVAAALLELEVCTVDSVLLTGYLLLLCWLWTKFLLIRCFCFRSVYMLCSVGNSLVCYFSYTSMCDVMWYVLYYYIMSIMGTRHEVSYFIYLSASMNISQTLLLLQE